MGRKVPATIVDDVDRATDVPGAIEFRCMYGGDETPVGIGFICPCGCGREGWLPLRVPKVEHPSWEWDGDREKPTLKPSVLQVGGCRWHGWLRAGVWEEC